MKSKVKPTIQVERWKTVTNRNSKREDHYFIQQGLNPVYAFGYNPDLFSKSDIKKIVKMIKVKP